MKYTALVSALVLCLLTACHERLREPADKPIAPEPAASLSLGERLAREAADRPNREPRPETMAAALAEKGLALIGWKQVLASAVGARFCMAGQTAAGSAVAVCEFGDADQAESGLAYSRKTFDRLIPNRTLVRRAGSVLTVARGDASAPGIDEARTITSIFAAL